MIAYLMSSRYTYLLFIFRLAHPAAADFHNFTSDFDDCTMGSRNGTPPYRLIYILTKVMVWLTVLD